MTKYGALLAVLSNLENEDYVKTVLGKVDDFVALVEDEFNDVHEADISMWLSNFIDTDARLAP
jgi:non-homologous end joining protein Ku